MCQSDDISYNEQNEYAWKQSADKNDLNSFVGLCGGTTPPPTGGTPPFPGTNLSVGSSGSNVRLIQQAINTIAPCHPGRLWVLNVDGNFGNMTRDAVFSFQSVFGMPVTGVVNQATWNRLMQEAANVSEVSMGGDGDERENLYAFPGYILRMGSHGSKVINLQSYLNRNPGVVINAIDGNFDSATQKAVMTTQRLHGLKETGIVDSDTWNAIVSGADAIQPPYYNYTPTYPGYLLQMGTIGHDVWVLQRYLNGWASNFNFIQHIAEDSIYGSNTFLAVQSLQRRFGLVPDGIVGPKTWAAIVVSVAF